MENSPRGWSSTATICAARWCGSRTRSSRRTPAAEAPQRREPAVAALLVGIHTRGAVLARRLHALVGELTGSEVPLGDLDISFYRDDLDGREPGRPAGRPHLAPRLRPRRAHGGPRRRRHVHRPHRARGDRRPVRLRPPRARPARGARRPRPPRAADPARLRRQEPADRPRRARLRPPRGDRRGRRGGDRAASTSAAPRRMEDADEAPALDRGPRARRHRADHGRGRRASPRSAAATSRRSRPCAAARSSASSTSPAPGPARRSSSPPSGSRPTSSRSSPRGSSVDKGESLKDTIATLSAYAPEAIVIRHPHAGAAAAGHAAGPTPRSSTPATASTSTRARRCSTSTRCSTASPSARGSRRDSTASGSGSSATSSTAASPAPARSASGRWAPRSRSAGRRR